MIVCKGCGSPVSKEAAACPKCGQPGRYFGLGGTLFGMAAFIGLLFVAICAAILLGWI